MKENNFIDTRFHGGLKEHSMERQDPLPPSMFYQQKEIQLLSLGLFLFWKKNQAYFKHPPNLSTGPWAPLGTQAAARVEWFSHSVWLKRTTNLNFGLRRWLTLTWPDEATPYSQAQISIQISAWLCPPVPTTTLLEIIQWEGYVYPLQCLARPISTLAPLFPQVL